MRGGDVRRHRGLVLEGRDRQVEGSDGGAHLRPDQGAVLEVEPAGASVVDDALHHGGVATRRYVKGCEPDPEPVPEAVVGGLHRLDDTGDLAQAKGGESRQAGTAFRFARQGDVNVFYWVDGPFGYALSTQAGQGELARVSAEVYRQLSARIPER